MPAAMLDHTDRPIFQNYLRYYVNEYGHFEKLQKEKRKINGRDNPSIKSCSNLSVKMAMFNDVL